MSHQVFISFSSKDIKLAGKIYDRLEKNGITCWISSKNIPAGADYQACIVDAINQATIVVLIFSTHANSSNEIAKELSLASKKILIPTRIEDVLPQGAFQYQLSNRQFIDLFDDFDNRLDELSDRIQNALNSGAASPVTPRKKSVNWKKIGLQFAVAVGLAGLGVGGLFAARGYLYTPNPASKQVASLSAPLTTAVNSTAQATGDNNSATMSSLAVTAAPTTSADTSEASASKKTVVASLPTITSKSTAAILSPAVLINTPRPALEISEKVNGLTGMLKDTQRQARANALKDMLVSLPKNLNSKEAEVLLKNTDQYRTAAITTIAGNLANSLNGDDVATILGDASRQGRLVALQGITAAGKVKKDLTADEASKVLASTEQYRTDSIAVLAPYLAENLGGVEVAIVLGDDSRQGRLVALQRISAAGKIKKNLTADEASKVLASTEQYRTDSIAVLAPYLAENLGGAEVALVLGDNSRQGRLVALATMTKLGKIKRGLKPDEAQLILKGMEQYASNALTELAPFLAK